MSEPTERPVRGKRMVADALILRILTGEYPPAQPLPHEATLLKEFGVSRTCLREALQMLGAKGLVRSRPKLGTFVRERHDWNFLDADILRLRQQIVSRPVFLRELFAVRRMMEPETAALAAVNIAPELLAKLQKAVLGMASGNGARTAVTMEADVSFHRILLAASGNALLSGLGACIEQALHASIGITSHPEVEFPFALDKHIAVFQAVSDRNPDAARAAMIALLEMTEETLESVDYGESMPTNGD